jgi:type I restriction enzyme, S subunit
MRELAYTFPKDWDAKTIGDIACHVGSGATPTGGSSIYSKTGITFIRSQNVTFKGLLLDDVAFIELSIHRQMARSEIFPHDVLLNITGASIGRCCFVPYSFGIANVNQHVCAIRLPMPSHEDAVFLAGVLASHIGQSQIDRLNAGGNREGLNYQQVRSFSVPWPMPEERKRIAAVLEAVDEAIAKTEAVIGKLRQVRAGLLHDLLTCGLDEHGKLRDPIAHPEQFQDSSLGQIPRAWEVKTCQSICREIVVGIVVKPAQYYVEEGVPVLRSANVREEGIQMTDLVFISDDSNALLSKSILRTGDVVTVRTGYPGTSCVVPSHLDGANCVDLIISRPSAEIVPAFLALWINSPFGRDQILKVQGGLAQQHFNVGELKTLLIAKPDRDEQVRIVERIALLDSCISLEVETGAKLSRLKSGLMSDLLTGRVRVPESVSAVENQP